MAFDDERFWDRLSAPKLSPVGKFVEAKSLGLDASSAGILHRNRSQRSTIVSIAVFLGTLPYLSMKRSHNFIEYAFTTPVFIVPKHRPCTVASLWASLPNCSHSSTDRTLHP